jgi:signal peptidase II
MKKTKKILFFCILIIVLIICDKITKEIAKDKLMNKDAVSLFYGTVRLDYVENTGAFLSLGDDLPAWAGISIFIVLPMAFLLFLLGYTIKKSDETGLFKLICLALIIAGGLGNVVDRMLYNMHVSDFMVFGIGALRTGVVNMADMYVTFGIIAFLFTFRKNDSQPQVDKK